MSRERRLLVVTESLGVGGTESHLLRILPHLSAQGWKIAVFCLTGRGERAAELENNNIEVVSSRRNIERNTMQRRHPKRVALAAGSLFHFMRRWRPVIAHFYLPGPYVIGAPIAMAQNVPFKVMSRRSLSDYQKNWPVVAHIERMLHQRMDALIGNSQAVVSQLLAEKASEDRIELIYNGIEITQFLTQGDARRKLGISDHMLIGVVVANLIHYKGHIDLLRGLGLAAPHLPPDWCVLFAGRDEGQETKLKELAQCLGLTDHVRFLGQRSDVNLLASSADFSMLTSHEEGFSNVLLEGMAAGLPMIVTDVGGNPEAVVNGETGLVVPAHNPKAIGEAILQIANDAELRQRLGAAGRDRVKQEFSLEVCVTKHADLYDKLLLRSPAHRGVVAATSSQPAPVYLPSRRPLMLAYWGRYGALPQLTLELARACQRAGRDAETTISVSTSNELFDRYLSLGESVFPVITYPSALSAANYRAAGRVRALLKQRLREDGTRGFVTLMPHVWSPLAVPILKKAGVRHTVIVHDADPHKGDNTALINRWLMREAESADAVVTLTAAVAERLVQKGTIPAKKITVLFHPDLNYASPRERNGGPLRVLFFGRILPYKGLSLFVDAMELLKQTGLPIEIGVFGKGSLGADRARLERLDAEVVNRWIDPQHIAAILARHDIVVVSHTEASQSGVIAAAYGAGLPVVATPVGGLKEQIIPGLTGIVAETVTATAIASAVKRLAEDRNVLDQLREGIMATRQQRSIDDFLSALSEIALGGSLETRAI